MSCGCSSRRRCHAVAVHVKDVMRLQFTSKMSCGRSSRQRCHAVAVHVKDAMRSQFTSKMSCGRSSRRRCHAVAVHAEDVMRSQFTSKMSCGHLSNVVDGIATSSKAFKTIQILILLHDKKDRQNTHCSVEQFHRNSTMRSFPAWPFESVGCVAIIPHNFKTK